MSKKALISVSKKAGIIEFAQELESMGWEIISSGGTASELSDGHVQVTTVEEVTGYPAMLGHRVATLHPNIHGGILARRISEDDKDLRDYAIDRIDLVCVDLYPVEEYAIDPYRTLLEILDKVDIGGPTLIRGAAKNYPHGLTVVCDPADRVLVLKELKKYGRVRELTRAKLAAKVFAVMAYYNGITAQRMYEEFNEKFLHLSSFDRIPLRYGQNPHQEASVFLHPNHAGPFGKHNWKVVFEGKPMSFNNWQDVLAATYGVSRFTLPACVVCKHLSPCGISTGICLNPATLFRKAWNGDALSAFGGVIAVNFTVKEQIAKAMAKNFFEVLVCDDIEKEALKILKKKRKNLRIIKTSATRFNPQDCGQQTIHDMGITLVQDRNIRIPRPEDFMLVSETSATEHQFDQLPFAATCCLQLYSNATAIVKSNAMIGYGRGQASRIYACRDAVNMAMDHVMDKIPLGCVAVTDGFFPKPDGIRVLIEAGVKVIAAPAGGLDSKEVIAEADKYGVSFYHINHRLFRH